jgi:hypothetical protein
MIVDIVDKYLTDDNNPIKNLRLKFFFDFFCRNQNLMAPRACNTRFLKIVFEIFESRYLTFKHFCACSACDEIGSQYAQHAMKLVPRMLSVR